MLWLLHLCQLCSWGAVLSAGHRVPRPPPGSFIRTAGFLLKRRLFSTPLALEPRANGQEYFQVYGPKLPDYLAQFQEAFDIALENLPQVDWKRCANGDASVVLLARQTRVWHGPRSQDANRPKEPEDEEDVFMNVPHHDDYWPGAEFFVVSDAPLRTLFYPEGPNAMPGRFPPGTVMHYDARAIHSAPGFCPASEQKKGVSPVVRTFVRIHARDPLWSISRLPGFTGLLQPMGPAEWHRPSPCEAQDVFHGCFDETYSCERCCDPKKGPWGDAACWDGWRKYSACCGLASRLWAGCGWQQGVDLWAHEYFSLEPPRLRSVAQCHSRCEEDPGCGGWTYFPGDWEPIGCRVPVSAIFALRRVCILRVTVEAPPTLHEGIVWGYRDCEEPDGCVRYGVDQLGQDAAFLKEVPSIAACRSHCQEMKECKVFSYFPDSYVGDARPDCVMPLAVLHWWQSRCLLKASATAQPWVLPMGNVASSSRHCSPARPWLLWANKSMSDDLLAVDGDYRRERCVTRQPWRIDLDAEYTVSQAMLWTGDFAHMPFRQPLTYHVVLVMANEEEILCGTSYENLGGNAMTVQCSEEAARKAVRSVIVHALGPAEGFSLCEFELRVAAIPCGTLMQQSWILHGRQVHLFPPGEARLAQLEGAGEACERAGGSFVERAGGTACVEGGCAPSQCLEDFDMHSEVYASLTAPGLWATELEAVADGCDALEVVPPGRMYEATIMIFNGGRPEVGGVEMTTHWCFCAPSHCTDDEAATVATRLIARQGLTWEALQPNSEIELRNVRALGRWEDMKLDFLIAGFARSGTHSVRGNLMEHKEVKIAQDELTFNWPARPQQLQVRNYLANFQHKGESERRPLWGGKGEGVAFSQRVLRLASKIPQLRLMILVREPLEWLESLYNLRNFECLYHKACGNVPSLEDVIMKGASFEDVKAEDAFLSRSLEYAVQFFPPSFGRLLLLEFELLRSRPREAFDRITSFLGIQPFGRDYTFLQHATEDRAQYESLGQRVSLCSESMKHVLEAFKERLARSNEHYRLATLLAQAGASWVSSRLLLNRTHCD